MSRDTDRRSAGRPPWCVAVALLLVVGWLDPVRAATIGMVADNSHSVTVFDADADTVSGAVPLPGFSTATGDCSIAADQKRGFVTDFQNHVFVIDVTTPSLAGGPNPIPIVNSGEDTSISPDGKFLLVCDGSNPQAVSVVSIAAQVQIGSFSLGSDCNSVEACDDGSVLVTSFNTGLLRRLTIDGGGTLTDTGEQLFAGSPVNAYCAPGGASGIVLFTGTVESFTIPGLVPVDTVALNFPSTGAINNAGTRFFVRNGTVVDAFAFTAATGALGVAPLFTIAAGPATGFFGMDQVAVHPNDKKLYVSEGTTVGVYDTSNGALLTTLTDPSLSSATGICFAKVVSVCGDGVVQGAEDCDEGPNNGSPSSCCTPSCTPVCDDADPCTDDLCDSTGPAFVCSHAFNTAPCTLPDRCIVGSTCMAGACGGGSPRVCDDANPCTDDFCNSSTGGCFAIPNTAPCNDLNPCTDHDQCSFGVCRGTDNTAPCNDGNPCTAGDQCSFGFCQPGPPVDCDDHNPCTTEFCSPFVGCQFTPLSGTKCQDDNPCTTDDVCVAGFCVGEPRNCFDDDPCTVDSCNSAGGAFLCQHEDCNAVPGSNCPVQCRPAFCGNGRLDPGETCDPPDATPQPGRPGQVTCRQDCTFCGDGITQTGRGETCDDGNLVTGCDPAHPTRPLDACQTSCTPPICQDPAKIRYRDGVGILDVHGRIEPVAPATALDPTSRTFVVELTDAAGTVVFRSSLEAGQIVPRGAGFRFADATAAVNGGIARLKFAPRGTSYRVTLTAYGDLSAATGEMTTHLFIGAEEWTLAGRWLPASNGWKLDARSAQ